MAKTALIVDDSASARFILSRLLLQHELNVDTAESAEDALQYLTQQRPDVIFMDHLMPGMDGFQAVKAIKANPATATIPIMMYTSQEGELYVGQARALGALGVLPKQVKPVEVSKVLHSLRLVPTGPDGQLEHDEMAVVGPAAAPDSLRELLEELFHQHRKALQEEIRQGYERLEVPAAQPPEVDRKTRSQAILGVGLLLVALVGAWFGYLYVQASNRWSEANERNTELLTTIQEQRSIIEVQQAAALASSAEEFDLTAIVGALEWAVNQTGTYGVDEIALNDDRAESLRDLAANLQAIGFAGVIEYSIHVGQFCMVFSEQGTLVLAPQDLPLGSCLQLGWQDQEAFVLAERQTLAFANAVAQINGRATTANIEVEIAPRGQRLPNTPYPPASPEILAGDWNQRAAASHRIEIRLLQR
jgi:CheY-like chemotaxis protein